MKCQNQKKRDDRSDPSIRSKHPGYESPLESRNTFVLQRRGLPDAIRSYGTRSFILIATLLGLLTSSCNHPKQPSPAHYATVIEDPPIQNALFPLKRGLAWRYSNSWELSDTLSLVVTDIVNIANQTYVLVDERYVTRSGKVLSFPGYWRASSDGKLWYIPGHSTEERGILYPNGMDSAATVFYDFGSRAGDAWQVRQRGMIGVTLHRQTIHLISSNDTVHLADGIVSGCFRFAIEVGPDQDYEDWFAPGLGLVKRETQSGGVYRLNKLSANDSEAGRRKSPQ